MRPLPTRPERRDREVITGILIGAAAFYLPGLLFCLFDARSRDELLTAMITVLAVFVLPFMLLLHKIVDGNFRVRRIPPEVLRRFASLNEVRGWAIHRHGRAYIVITDPKARKSEGTDQ